MSRSRVATKRRWFDRPLSLQLGAKGHPALALPGADASAETPATGRLPTGVRGRRGDASAYAELVTDHVYVVRTEVIDADRVDVIVDFASSHAMRCHCERTIDGWIEAGDIVE